MIELEYVEPKLFDETNDHKFWDGFLGAAGVFGDCGNKFRNFFGYMRFLAFTNEGSIQDIRAVLEPLSSRGEWGAPAIRAPS